MSRYTRIECEYLIENSTLKYSVLQKGILELTGKEVTPKQLAGFFTNRKIKRIKQDLIGPHIPEIRQLRYVQGFTWKAVSRRILENHGVDINHTSIACRMLSEKEKAITQKGYQSVYSRFSSMSTPDAEIR